MSDKEQNIRTKILNELMEQFPDLNPKIAEITEHSFIYELEKHSNFTYYLVKYNLDASGELTIDWENSELTVY